MKTRIQGFSVCVFASCLSEQFCVLLFEAFLDEAERKYLFECDSEEQCVEWVDAIIKAR